MDNCAPIPKLLSQISHQGAIRGSPGSYPKLPFSIGIGLYNLPCTCLQPWFCFILSVRQMLLALFINEETESQALWFAQSHLASQGQG